MTREPFDVQAFAKRIHELLALSALREGGRHGYQIALDVEERSGGMFAFQHGTLYPILHRLEAEGRIRGEWEPGGGRRRKVYTLTAAGRASLESGASRCWEVFLGLRRMIGEGGDAEVRGRTAAGG